MAFRTSIAAPLALLASALSGCDPAAPSNTAAAAAAPDPMEAKIAALSPELQRTTMFRAIRDGGYTCQEITRFEKKPPVDGKATWVAECEDRGQYVIALQPGGIFWVSGVPQPKRGAARP